MIVSYDARHNKTDGQPDPSYKNKFCKWHWCAADYSKREKRRAHKSLHHKFRWDLVQELKYQKSIKNLEKR